MTGGGGRSTEDSDAIVGSEILAERCGGQERLRLHKAVGGMSKLARDLHRHPGIFAAAIGELRGNGNGAYQDQGSEHSIPAFMGGNQGRANAAKPMRFAGAPE
jgi:hypothetical protein